MTTDKPLSIQVIEYSEYMTKLYQEAIKTFIKKELGVDIEYD